MKNTLDLITSINDTAEEKTNKPEDTAAQDIQNQTGGKKAGEKENKQAVE